MRVLVIDVGGTHVKVMHSGSPEIRKFDSGEGFTPRQVVDGVRATVADWTYDAATIGVPSPVLRGDVITELSCNRFDMIPTQASRNSSSSDRRRNKQTYWQAFDY